MLSVSALVLDGSESSMIFISSKLYTEYIEKFSTFKIFGMKSFLKKCIFLKYPYKFYYRVTHRLNKKAF